MKRCRKKNYRSIPVFLLTIDDDEICTADFSPRNYDDLFYVVTHTRWFLSCLFHTKTNRWWWWWISSSSRLFSQILFDDADCLIDETFRLSFNAFLLYSLPSSLSNRVSNCFTTLLLKRQGSSINKLFWGYSAIVWFTIELENNDVIIWDLIWII